MANLVQLGGPSGGPAACGPSASRARSRDPKPEWLKVRMPGGGRYEQVKRTLRELNLHTVCEEASCPNVGECWGGGTATVMLMGDVCTRGCRFCDVASGTPRPLDPLEPRHLAEAVGRLGLDYLVVTSVNRDELDDGGASHFAQAIVELRRAAPSTLVEVLTPDFQGRSFALDMIADAGPAVAAHNVETVERLSPRVRDRRASHAQSLGVLAYYKKRGLRTKSSIMLGLGERRAEVVQTMKELRSVGCDILTLGQYLRPTEKHLEVVEFVRPEVFAELEQEGLSLGFKFVAAGPLVRSSYKAGEFFVQRWIEEERLPIGSRLG
jgi:lipoyl synthase